MLLVGNWKVLICISVIINRGYEVSIMFHVWPFSFLGNAAQLIVCGTIKHLWHCCAKQWNSACAAGVWDAQLTWALSRAPWCQCRSSSGTNSTAGRSSEPSWCSPSSGWISVKSQQWMATLGNSSFSSQLSRTLRILLEQNSIHCSEFQGRNCFEGQDYDPVTLFLSQLHKWTRNLGIDRYSEQLWWTKSQEYHKIFSTQELYAVNSICNHNLWIKIYH